ncbi:MAG: hypothetical protein EOO40_00620 [Deltaproteobacteria bacterium]|nr:MAG: hypothetical protein EOO40_00620 [Deltaproteobacteria bacterium]
MIRFHRIDHQAIYSREGDQDILRVSRIEGTVTQVPLVYRYASGVRENICTMVGPRDGPMNLAPFATINQHAPPTSALQEGLKSGAISSTAGFVGGGMLGAMSRALGGPFGILAGAIVGGASIGALVGIRQYNHLNWGQLQDLLLQEIAYYSPGCAGGEQGSADTLADLRELRRACVVAGGAAVVAFVELEKALDANGVRL